MAAVGLVQKVDLDLGTTLIVTGLYNIASGWQFGIPMCVQPMKTIAAVALAATQPALTLSQLLHAGLFVAGCVLVLGASRLVDAVNWLVPRPVVRGVQLAVGAKLAIKGIDMALRVHPGAGAAAVPQWRPLLGVDGLLLGGSALALLLATTIAPRVFPPGSEDATEDGGLGPRPKDIPFEPLMRRLERRKAAADDGGGGGGETWRDLREGALRAGLPQLPLTTLNSVIAVTHLADSLFPERQVVRLEGTSE
ncbi:hypothetical protein GPECTOR_16g715 [Gonium pectorale]|uniref:Uncharacterized protein n=1 Tax=Gonium pectorale TaxID=33097 RepID=A0A150GMI0_GONPE|nr:hypothetical protein GPECTOR_16g715 [Gonium pectorale]|eukprot:KXZ50540.1 hypothetical protein GPECTOR_16g715 [Gonium pectorale]